MSRGLQRAGLCESSRGGLQGQENLSRIKKKVTNLMVKIIGSTRTPLAPQGGHLSAITSIMLGTCAMNGLGEQAQIDPKRVSLISMGSLFSAGMGPNPAQRSGLEAGLGEDVLAMTHKSGPGSALTALLAASGLLKSDAIAIVGGLDSATTQPYLIPSARRGARLGSAKLTDGANAEAWTGEDDVPLNVTAELQAQRLKITKDNRQAYLERQRDRQQSLPALTPLEVIKKRHVETVTADVFEPAFDQWRAPLADGAAMLAIACQGDGPELVAWTQAGTVPNHSPEAPVIAAKKLLDANSWTASDISILEIDESLGLASMLAIRHLEIPEERVNPYGGSLLRGYPGGACSAVSLVHLDYYLRQHKGLGLISYGTSAGGALALAFRYQ